VERHRTLGLAGRFSRRLPAPAPRRPGARRKNAFPNGSGIYGARTMAAGVLDKATRYALLSSCPPPRARPPTTRRSTRCTSFPSAPASMISLLCLGKRVAQCAPRRLNPRGRPFLRAVGIPEANLRGTLDRHDHPG